MKKTTLKANALNQRIQRAIEYIYDHLDQDVSLDTVAQVACFSPFHFHRLYRGVTGESMARTIRRLRLQRAGRQLVETDLSLDRIARKARYESTESFIRKFSQEFDISPQAYRKAGRSFILKTKQPIKETLTMYDVTIETFNDIPLAAYDHKGDYLEIGKVFEKLFATAGAHNLMSPHTRSFGIYYDDPSGVPKDDLRSKAGLTIGDDFKEVDGLKKTVIKGGKYATLIHKGPYTLLEAPYKWFYEKWILEKGYEPANEPPVEEYLNNPREVPPSELLTKICIPLK